MKPDQDQCGYCGGWNTVTYNTLDGVCPTHEPLVVRDNLGAYDE